MHPRNRHQGRYDFAKLAKASPELSAFVRPGPGGEATIDFADRAAIEALNRALMREFYDVPAWRIPPGYLVPPIPGRADYVHHAADLLAEGGPVPKGAAVRALDVGIGAGCVYPAIAHREYGWRFVGTDVDTGALESARLIADSRPALSEALELRHQTWRSRVLREVIDPADRFDLVICNPPFHATAKEAKDQGRRKLRGLGLPDAAPPAFGGGDSELWFPGGEDAFARRMIAESAELPDVFLWLTILLSKNETLPGVLKAANKAGAADVRSVDMEQGHKKSRFLAWTFLPPEKRRAWRARRGGGL